MNLDLYAVQNDCFNRIEKRINGDFKELPVSIHCFGAFVTAVALAAFNSLKCASCLAIQFTARPIPFILNKDKKIYDFDDVKEAGKTAILQAVSAIVSVGAMFSSMVNKTEWILKRQARLVYVWDKKINLAKTEIYYAEQSQKSAQEKATQLETALTNANNEKVYSNLKPFYTQAKDLHTELKNAYNAWESHLDKAMKAQDETGQKQAIKDKKWIDLEAIATKIEKLQEAYKVAEAAHNEAKRIADAGKTCAIETKSANDLAATINKKIEDLKSKLTSLNNEKNSETLSQGYVEAKQELYEIQNSTSSYEKHKKMAEDTADSVNKGKVEAEQPIPKPQIQEVKNCQEVEELLKTFKEYAKGKVEEDIQKTSEKFKALKQHIEKTKKESEETRTGKDASSLDEYVATLNFRSKEVAEKLKEYEGRLNKLNECKEKLAKQAVNVELTSNPKEVLVEDLFETNTIQTQLSVEKELLKDCNSILTSVKDILREVESYFSDQKDLDKKIAALEGKIDGLKSDLEDETITKVIEVAKDAFKVLGHFKELQETEAALSKVKAEKQLDDHEKIKNAITPLLAVVKTLNTISQDRFSLESSEIPAVQLFIEREKGLRNKLEEKVEQARDEFIEQYERLPDAIITKENEYLDNTLTFYLDLLEFLNKDQNFSHRDHPALPEKIAKINWYKDNPGLIIPDETLEVYARKKGSLNKARSNQELLVEVLATIDDLEIIRNNFLNKTETANETKSAIKALREDFSKLENKLSEHRQLYLEIYHKLGKLEENVDSLIPPSLAPLQSTPKKASKPK